MQYKKILLLLFLVFCSYGAPAQEFQNGTNVYLSPRVNIGYTFGAGINYGVDFVVGIYSTKNFNFGIAYSHYFVNVPKDFHRFKTLSIVIENPMINMKFGAGKLSRKWGLKNINKASIPGLAVDVTVGLDQYRAPWFGVKVFLHNRNLWNYFDQPSYISAYTYFKTPEIEVYESKK